MKYGREAEQMFNIVEDEQHVARTERVDQRGFGVGLLAHEAALAPFVVATRPAFLDWVYTTPNPAVRAEQWPTVALTEAALERDIRRTIGYDASKMLRHH